MTADSRSPALVVALMGPTATGKSALALALAERLDIEIVNVDSAQVYRGMDVGTAKPTVRERDKVKHHLIDILEPEEPCSAGLFRDLAEAAVAEILERGKIPLLVGGTFLYFRALLGGLADLPSADAALRARLNAEARVLGWCAMHARLAQVDPVAASRIHPNDAQRIQRALEAYELSGRPISQLHRDSTPKAELPFRVKRIGLRWTTRSAHRSHIRRRFETMLELGLVEEVSRLRSRIAARPDLPAWRAVGYRQVLGYLAGECDYATMVELAVTATCQYAKRQETWLRRESIDVPYVTEDADVAGKIVDAIRAWKKAPSIGQGLLNLL